MASTRPSTMVCRPAGRSWKVSHSSATGLSAMRGGFTLAEGAVVNLIDQRVWSLTPHFMSYTISKAGLWAMTQTLALALAPRIRVNGIGPGPALASTRQTAEQFARQAGSTPLGRGTSPEEVTAALLAILAFPSMTGQMIALDGGQHLQWAPSRDPADSLE